MAFYSQHTGAQVDEAVDKALSADAVPTPGSTNLVESGGVFGVVSNRNLLDNPFFTINQRGAADATTITGNNYFADRWQASGNGVQRVAGGGISVLGTAYHKLDNPGIAGKTVTLSILYSDGEISSNTFAWTGTQFSKTFKYGTVNIDPSANQINIGAQSVIVTAVKLEIGSVSTLANDAPPCFAEELAKCQRYFIKLNTLRGNYYKAGVCVAYSSTIAIALVPTPVTMNDSVAPAVNYGGSKLQNGNSRISVTGATFQGLGTNAVFLELTASGLTQGACYILAADAVDSAWLTISCDL